MDVDGLAYADDHDRPDQPDMCEIVRTLLAYKKFQNFNDQEVNLKEGVDQNFLDQF